jgi:hypothetical protein
MEPAPSYLLRRLFSENVFDGLRTRERPLSTLFHDPGDGMGDVDFESLFELVRLSWPCDPLDMAARKQTLGLDRAYR